MIAFLRRKLDDIRGSGDAAVTVPSMDGALRPNSLLDSATALASVRRPDHLCDLGGEVVYSSGNAVFALHDGAERHRFGSEVTALAAGPDGALAVGLADGSLKVLGGAHAKTDLSALGLTCPVALAFDGPATLYAANGSDRYAPGEWKHDLMTRGASGAVWRIDLASGRGEKLMTGLAWPLGLALSPEGLVVVESWRHRVLTRDAAGTVRPRLTDLPAYPARIAPAADGGWWLALFAPRNQLTEFILREPGFRDAMMAEVDPQWWAAPALEPSDSFLRPLQGGAQKHLGVVKPWAPSQSYGLVLRLDAAFRPRFSQHSRADGRRHGVTSVIESGGRVLAAAKGGDVILSLDVTQQGGRR